MIPVSKDERLKHTDAESGIVFEFKPVIGSTETILYRASDCLSKIGESYDILAVGTSLDEIIDATLCGWTGGAEGLPAFPADGKPSQMFKIKDKIKMLSVICELNGLSVAEQKN